MKDMLGQEVVIGDTVIFTDYKDNHSDTLLTGGVVFQIKKDILWAEDKHGRCYELESPEFVYYTTIKDLTL